MYIIFTQSDCDIFSRKIEKKLKMLSMCIGKPKIGIYTYIVRQGHIHLDIVVKK